MKNGILRQAALPLILLLAAACNQDPIFYTISREIAPREPRIAGTPTNYAALEWGTPPGKPVFFTAAGSTIHWYSSSGWDNGISGFSQPGGKIRALAATTNYLYALTDSLTVKRIKNGQGWETLELGNVGSYSQFQSIYAPPDQDLVFFGAGASTTSFAILYLDDSSSTNKVKLVEDTGGGLLPHMLTGAAYDGTDYYLTTNKNVVYQVSSSGTVTANGTWTYPSDVKFKGIISLETTTPTIVAIDRGGTIYVADTTAGAIKSTGKSMGNYATGALAIWRDTYDYQSWSSGSSHPAPKLLLAGKQDSLTYSTVSGYTHGYREFEINSAGYTITGDFSFIGGPHEPGVGSVTSAGDNERYRTTIGKLPVNYLFQAPYNVDNSMILFASTQKNGVWSYRDRDGMPQWNAED
jgi:hypothetical protein